MVALKFCDVLPMKAADARRRTAQEILLEAIGHQVALCKDQAYVVERQRYMKTEEGYKRVLTAKPPRKWWFQGKDGNWYLQIHLGTKAIELEPGKPTLVCGKSEKDIIPVLDHVASLIKDGKFEDAINAAHAQLKRKKAGC